MCKLKDLKEPYNSTRMPQQKMDQLQTRKTLSTSFLLYATPCQYTLALPGRFTMQSVQEIRARTAKNYSIKSSSLRSTREGANDCTSLIICFMFTTPGVPMRCRRRCIVDFSASASARFGSSWSRSRLSTQTRKSDSTLARMMSNSRMASASSAWVGARHIADPINPRRCSISL